MLSHPRRSALAPVLSLAGLLLCFGESPYAQTLPPLAIAPGATHLTAGDAPFLWIGDTAWELFHRLDSGEVRHYLDTRARQGVNVVQAVGLAELDGLRVPNANGDVPLVGLDPAQLNEPYWAYVDWVVDECAARGMYVALLPTWGDKFNPASWGVGPDVFTPDNAAAFAKTLGARYADRTHVTWVLGGDRWPEDDDDRVIVAAMARGLRAGGAGQLITYHPNGARRATKYFDDDWLDYEMFQTGHDRRQLDFAYVRASREQGSRPRPVVNAEPRYEDHPDRFDQGAYEWMDQADVRQALYWTFFAGGAGYTYGCHDVWQMWAPGREAVNGARTHWRTALGLPGAHQLDYARDFLERTDWSTYRPAQELVVYDSAVALAPTFLRASTGLSPKPAPLALRGTAADSAQVLAAVALDGGAVLAYAPYGGSVGLRVGPVRAALGGGNPSVDQLVAAWFNPRDGRVVAAAPAVEDGGVLTVAAPSRGWGSDYVLVVYPRGSAVASALGVARH